MKRLGLLMCSATGVLAVALAGCGSSSSSSSGGASSAAAPSASSSSATSAPAASGPYGATSSASTTPSSAPASSAHAVVLTTKHAKMGTVLAAGPKRLTVYLFEADKGANSSCTGACAAAWPPVLGQPKAAGQANSSDLGTIKRADGTTQVTYKGHPLYFFVKDKDDGDAYGQGVTAFGAGWYVLAPSGNKIDNS